MTRELLLLLSRQASLRRWMERSNAARNFTRRFVAGETLQEEMDACARLQSRKILATLDHLGENVTSLTEAAAARDAYLEALELIAQRGLKSTISLKLTQMGLDFSEPACLGNVSGLVRRARQGSSMVEIDMESTAYTDRTLRIVEQVAGECGAHCVRAVIQAYLFRSAADVDRLNSLRIPIRLVKGAYREPESAAFPKKIDVDKNYVALMKTLLDRGSDPAIATHDERILEELLRYAAERGLTEEQFEIQMLYGIRRDLQDKFADRGYRVRVYVPYGTAWYPYFMRRLAERPANALFLLRNLFR